MGKINTRRHIGDLLYRRGIITQEQLMMARHLLEREPDHTGRRIGQILWQDLHLDRHTVMKEIAGIYAFDELFEGEDELPRQIVREIKSCVDELPREIVEELAGHKAVPVHKTSSSVVIAASDPSDPRLSHIISRLGFKQAEVAYCRYELVESILTSVYEQKNEFLDLLEEIEYEEAPLEDPDERSP